MKHHYSSRSIYLMSGMLALTCVMAQVNADTEIPRGTLNVDRTLVRVGTRTQLDWQIAYPAGITDVIDVTTTGVKTKTNLTVRVRVLGASFQQTATTFLPVQVVWSKNKSTWARVFDGKQTDVNPAKVMLETTVSKGDTINIGGRGYRNGWLPLYTTAAATPNLVILKNEDRVPGTTPAFQQGMINSFLKPYLSSDGKKVKIGNLDLIILLELGQTDPRASGFDLQDLVVLVTFEESTSQLPP